MNDIGYLLRKATKKWKEGVQTAVQPLGLTVPAYLLLSSVYRFQYEVARAPSQKEAAVAVGLDLNIASQTLKYLLSHHLVNRQRDDDDSRSYKLSLTLAGEQLTKTAKMAIAEFEEIYFSEIDRNSLSAQLMMLTNKSV